MTHLVKLEPSFYKNILREWFATHAGDVPNNVDAHLTEIAREAVAEFIVCHQEEFLPVNAGRVGSAGVMESMGKPPPALHHSALPVPLLSVETKTLLHIFFGALGAWLVLRSVPKLYRGRLEAIDNQLLRALRRPDDPAIPVGPKWLPQAAKDVTALGSGTNLTMVTGTLVGFLCINRRFRASWLLTEFGRQRAASLPVIERILCAASSNRSSTSSRFRPLQFS